MYIIIVAAVTSMWTKRKQDWTSIRKDKHVCIKLITCNIMLLIATSVQRKYVNGLGEALCVAMDNSGAKWPRIKHGVSHKCTRSHFHLDFARWASRRVAYFINSIQRRCFNLCFVRFAITKWGTTSEQLWDVVMYSELASGKRQSRILSSHVFAKTFVCDSDWNYTCCAYLSNCNFAVWQLPTEYMILFNKCVQENSRFIFVLSQSVRSLCSILSDSAALYRLVRLLWALAKLHFKNTSCIFNKI